MEEVFDADVDQSGEIDAAELRKVLNRSNLGDAADNFVKGVDKDGNKNIGFDEYFRVCAAERGPRQPPLLDGTHEGLVAKPVSRVPIFTRNEKRTTVF